MLTLKELKTKEVIDISSGARLGFISDIDADFTSGTLRGLVIPGRLGFFGMMKDDDIVIKWEEIKKIGDDMILVERKP